MKNLEFQDYDIVCFMKDSFSSSAAAEAAARFPDLQFRVYENTGLEEAITYARSSFHARLICVDCSDIDLLISQIEPLMQYCPPDTKVIIVGMKNDVAIFRDLVQRHISDYLVKPLNPEFVQRAMGNALQLTPQDNKDRTKRTGKVIMFLSTVGGAGSTTIATNTAHFLSNTIGKKVVIIDGDYLFGNVARLIDIKPMHALFEMLESPAGLDEVLLEQCMMPFGERLKVIASEEPLGELSLLDPNLVARNLNLLVEQLIDKFHYVILDMPYYQPSVWRKVYARTDVGFIVTPLTFTGLRNTIRIDGAMREEKPEAAPRIVINYNTATSTMKLKDFEEGFSRSINVTVPFETQANLCSDAGTPLIDEAPKFKEAIIRLIETISTSTVQKSADGIFDKILNAIKR